MPFDTYIYIYSVPYYISAFTLCTVLMEMEWILAVFLMDTPLFKSRITLEYFFFMTSAGTVVPAFLPQCTPFAFARWIPEWIRDFKKESSICEN